jgi:2-C-methyl-D-erythritol 4-phosphate cytidylyltransferase
VSGNPTDEVSVAVAAGKKVSLVEHHEPNLKVTWPHDVVMAEALLRGRERQNEE